VGIIAFLILGLCAGALAKLIFPGDDPGGIDSWLRRAAAVGGTQHRRDGNDDAERREQGYRTAIDECRRQLVLLDIRKHPHVDIQPEIPAHSRDGSKQLLHGSTFTCESSRARDATSVRESRPEAMAMARPVRSPH